MIVQGRVTARRIAVVSARAAAGSRYSSRYFMENVPAFDRSRRVQFVELIHPFQEFKDATRFHRIDGVQGKSDMDEDKVADLDVWHMFQTYVFRNPTKIDFPHQHVMCAIGLRDLPWDS